MASGFAGTSTYATGCIALQFLSCFGQLNLTALSMWNRGMWHTSVALFFCAWYVIGPAQYFVRPD